MSLIMKFFNLLGKFGWFEWWLLFNFLLLFNWLLLSYRWLFRGMMSWNELIGNCYMSNKGRLVVFIALFSLDINSLRLWNL